MSINITEKARGELLRLIEAHPGHFMRITVVPGGCAGMTYTAVIDDAAAEGDESIYLDESLSIFAGEGCSIFLEDLKIDYSDDLVRSGFRFSNPNASGSCGCGSSFTA